MRLVQYIAWCMTGILSLSGPAFANSTSHNKYTYVLKIQMPEDMKQTGSWQCLYKGERLVFHGNLAKLTEKRCNFSFSLVVTPEVRCSQRTILSSLRHIELIPGEQVHWFDLNLIFDKGIWKWEIIELAANDIPTMVPQHAIIFLYNPKLVKFLEKPYKTTYCLDTLYEGGCCNFELPTIVLAGNKEELEDALNYAPSAAIDVLPYHTPASCVTQIIDGIHCAIDVPAS